MVYVCIGCPKPTVGPPPVVAPPTLRMSTARARPMWRWRGCRPPKPLARISTDSWSTNRSVDHHHRGPRPMVVAVDPGMLLNSSVQTASYRRRSPTRQIFGFTPCHHRIDRDRFRTVAMPMFGGTVATTSCGSPCVPSSWESPVRGVGGTRATRPKSPDRNIDFRPCHHRWRPSPCGASQTAAVGLGPQCHTPRGQSVSTRIQGARQAGRPNSILTPQLLPGTGI